jgi:hypothetical protein
MTGTQPVQIEAENRMHRLWHTNCPNWMPESRHGVNTSAIMRYVLPDEIYEHSDGSPLYLAECLHCGGRAYIGLDRQRRIIVRQVSA